MHQLLKLREPEEVNEYSWGKDKCNLLFGYLIYLLQDIFILLQYQLRKNLHDILQIWHFTFATKCSKLYTNKVKHTIEWVQKSELFTHNNIAELWQYSLMK